MPSSWVWHRSAYKTAGFNAAIRVVTTEFEKLHKERMLYAPGMLAGFYAIVADKDRSFYWLEDAYRHKHSTGADRDRWPKASSRRWHVSRWRARSQPLR